MATHGMNYTYLLGGSNGSNRGTVTQTSSSTTVGTSPGDLGAVITQSINTAAGAVYVSTGAGVASSGWVALGPVHMHTVGLYQPVRVEDAGIKAGEIVAYRAWYTRRSDLKLTSVFAHHRWEYGKSEKTDLVVEMFFGSGFHAYKRPQQVMDEYCLPSPIHDFVVYGEVKLWGTVVEHEGGYRAEYAKIKRLSGLRSVGGWTKENEAYLDRLCKLYGVEKGRPWEGPYASVRDIPPEHNKVSVTNPIVVDSRTWTGLGW